MITELKISWLHLYQNGLNFFIVQTTEKKEENDDKHFDGRQKNNKTKKLRMKEIIDITKIVYILNVIIHFYF